MTDPAPRSTRQRRAIRDVLEAAHRPLSPAEVLELAQAKVSGLGMATVYRNLRAMHAEGVLASVEMAGDGARYELAGLRHHHHFSCTSCRRVFDVHGCPGNLGKLVPRGFALEGHDLVLYGRCKDCA